MVIPLNLNALEYLRNNTIGEHSRIYEGASSGISAFILFENQLF
jgi:hypothetical protein